MVDRTRRANIATLTVSGVASMAMQKALTAADDAGLPEPTDEELIAIGKEADFRATYGFDAKRDPKTGKGIQQGIGSPGNESLNHFASIRRYLGEAKFQTAIRKMWKENPDRAKKIGLEEPERISS
jgi:hypothetical protein